MTDPSDLLSNLTNLTNITSPLTDLPSDLSSWSFSAHILERLHESGGLFIALAPALISNILFQASDSVLIKRILSFIMGILIQAFLFHLTAVHSLIIVFAVYLLTRLFKQKSPAIVIIFILSYAIAYHKSFEQNGPTYSVWKDLYKFSLIPLFCKCISFAYCYADSFKHPNDLSIDQNKRKIAQFPSILNYFSYMFHYLSAFFGPPIDFYDFTNFTAATEEYKNYDKNLKGTFFNVLLASAAFFAYIVLTAFVDTTAIFTKGLPVDSSIIYEIYLICALGLISRLLYYSVAVASQASIELSGLSYNGMDEDWKSYFGRIKIINPSYMFENNIATIIEGWSPSYYVWMKRYIYVRVLPLEIIRKNMISKAIAIAISLGVTFIIFGIPLPGVISYAHLFLMILVATYLYRGQWRTRNYPVWLRSIGNILKWSYVYFAVSVFVAGIQINDWKIALGIYKRVGYIPVVIELVLLGYFFLMGWNKREEIDVKGEKKDVNEAIITDETSEYLHAIDRKKENERFDYLRQKKDK